MKVEIRKNIVTQIGILTRDIIRAKKTWEAFFDIPPQPISESEGYARTQATYNGEPLEGRIRQVCFNIDNLELELIEPIGESPSYWKECLDRDGPGIHHISFAVKNMPAAIAKLEQMDLKLMQKGEFPNGRYAYLDGRDTMDIILELLEKDNEV